MQETAQYPIFMSNSIRCIVEVQSVVLEVSWIPITGAALASQNVTENVLCEKPKEWPSVFGPQAKA